MKPYRFPLFYYAVLLCSIDLVAWALLEQQFVQSVSCGAVVAILLDTGHSMFPFALMIALYDIYYTGRAAFSLIPLIPALLARPLLQKYISTEAPHAHIIVWSCWYAINYMLARLIWPELGTNFLYTISHYCGNIVVLLGCLTIYKKGWLDNRF